MKKLGLLTALLFLSVTWVVAQTSGMSTSKSTSNSNTTIQGCLSGSAGSYTLTDQSGKTYQLAGDTSKFSDHVGEEVRVTGNESASSSSNSGSYSSSSSSSSSTSSSSKPTFSVSNVEKVSSTCSNTSK